MMERITILLAVAGGGSIGALLRYAISGWFVRKFPLGTLAANVAGCLLIGLLVGSLAEKDWLSPAWRHFLVMGLLGSLTTFSTFGYQCVELYLDGHYALAGLNVLSNLIIGLAAVALGLMLAHALVRV
jgi:fluoride exporter